MKTNIKISGILSAALLLFCLFAFKPIEEKKVIVIDAGHGGHDFGADVLGFQEKVISDAIAKKIKAFNTDDNLEIILIRDGDISMDLQKRVSIIKSFNPDLVISLHVNASKDISTNGVDAYVSSTNGFYEKSKESAERIVNEISGANLSKRKIGEAPFFVLKNSNCPAITLQMGFLSNKNDREYLTSEMGQNEIATKILKAIK